MHSNSDSTGQSYVPRTLWKINSETKEQLFPQRKEPECEKEKSAIKSIKKTNEQINDTKDTMHRHTHTLKLKCRCKKNLARPCHAITIKSNISRKKGKPTTANWIERNGTLSVLKVIENENDAMLKSHLFVWFYQFAFFICWLVQCVSHICSHAFMPITKTPKNEERKNNKTKPNRNENRNSDGSQRVRIFIQNKSHHEIVV